MNNIFARICFSIYYVLVFSGQLSYMYKGLDSTCLILMKVEMTEVPRVIFVMREVLLENHTWILCLSYLHENKQVEFNPYIYTLSKLSRFGYELSVF